VQARRGFTITELLAVIAIIGILAAAAAPSFVSLLRDRRVTEAARHVADLYRLARSRAMGRGSAVMVRWSSNAVPGQTDGHFAIWEAVAGPTTSGEDRLPSARCLTDWNTNATFVTSFDERRRHRHAAVGFRDENGTDLGFAEICFTPRGRAFIRTAEGGAFAPLTGVPRVEVTNMDSGMIRQVIIPPTGVARVETKL
jgi:type IV fimbrial biogenesis protein FimT